MNLDAKQKIKKLIQNQVIVNKLSQKKLLIVNFQKMIKKIAEDETFSQKCLVF